MKIDNEIRSIVKDLEEDLEIIDQDIRDYYAKWTPGQDASIANAIGFTVSFVGSVVLFTTAIGENKAHYLFAGICCACIFSFFASRPALAKRKLNKLRKERRTKKYELSIIKNSEK